MKRGIARFAYWAPRIITIILILFLIFLNWDVFSKGTDFWSTTELFITHNIPALVLLVILVFAWRYEFIGGIAFILAGLFYIVFIVKNTGDWYTSLTQALMISGPAFFIGILFFMNGYKKKSESILWRIIKWIFGGIGRGILGIVKFFSRKVHESREKAKITSSENYKMPAKFDEFSVKNKVSGDYNVFEKRLYEDSLIVLIFGKRGSGKTALGFKILENAYNKTKRKCYVLGVPQEVLPSWIDSVNDVEEVPSGGIVLVDEGALNFSSRESMSKSNKEISRLMAVARHKDLTLLFVTQNTGMIDANILKLADTLIVKEGSLLQLEMERNEIKKFYAKSKKYFDKLKGDRRKYAYIIDSDFEGVIEHNLPSFWSTKISKSRAGKNDFYNRKA